MDAGFNCCSLKVQSQLCCCRFALAIQPKNYLLFACHACNECVQLNLLRRWYFAHYGSAPDAAAQLEKAI